MARLTLLIVTGLSGAGKSLALKRLEDIGFYCVDNLPASLLPAFLERCESANPVITRAALAIDSRESAFGADWEVMIGQLAASGADYRILFLDSRDDVLQRRYAETRRRHPHATGGDIGLGIAHERAVLQPLKERAHAVIDTSDLKPMDFYARLEEALSLESQESILLLFMSFGYKRGLPVDADFVLDMRFLPNPFYEPKLRPLSGLDAPVREYVLNQEGAARFLNELEQMLRGVLPGFAAQGKQRLMVAFGCTGGRHRSVAAAEEMKRRFADMSHVKCFHRDIGTEAADIRTRFAPQEGNG